MIKKVKGGREKHYCEVCGELLYDLIPKESTITFLGIPVPEYNQKVYKKYKNVLGKEYCENCYAKNRTGGGYSARKEVQNDN